MPVIRALVKTAITRHGWKVIGIEDGYEGLIMPGKNRPLALADVRRVFIILMGAEDARPFCGQVLHRAARGLRICQAFHY